MEGLPKAKPICEQRSQKWGEVCQAQVIQFCPASDDSSTLCSVAEVPHYSVPYYFLWRGKERVINRHRKWSNSFFSKHTGKTHVFLLGLLCHDYTIRKPDSGDEMRCFRCRPTLQSGSPPTYSESCMSRCGGCPASMHFCCMAA